MVYRILFAWKYRKKCLAKAIGKILFECKAMNIPKTEVCSNYVHMLVKIPPKVYQVL
ncbi:MAG TPA: transposase [Candidatus Coprocola pullicola]|nr:transposase [Candidatus Coprocola pullicola]